MIIPTQSVSPNAPAPDQALLTLDAVPGGAVSRGVRLHIVDRELRDLVREHIRAGGRLDSILTVTVARPECEDADGLPNIFGGFEILEDGVCFVPHFPFERRVAYRARFNPRDLRRSLQSELVTLDFSFPPAVADACTSVADVFPSSDCLPENLLRLYVCFSGPMQRGRAEAEISILDENGVPARDVLYRAPVELWDREMQRLTVLLDPGRLKRGVGPNRELGPPLKVGRQYTLSVGSGMTDLMGRPIARPFHKPFKIAEAVREAVDPSRWIVVTPEYQSRQPLVLRFPRPLDWALLRHSITVERADQGALGGLVTIGRFEQEWSFVPASPWMAGEYEIKIEAALEDVCGNNLVAAFDRPMRSGGDITYGAESLSLAFVLN